MHTQLSDTGERMVPKHHKGKNIYGAHIGRYQAALPVVQGKVVLDIACGSGYGTKLISRAAKKVYGVDIDEETIQYANENYSGKNIEYKLGDGEAIPLETHSVDVVVSYETIEHIENYKKFMKEVKRVLKPGGVLLLSTPNDLEYIEDNHFHLHEFNYGELKGLVSKYFAFRKDYFQTLWLYSTILPLELQSKEWQHPLFTMNTIPLDPEKCIYFFMLCSDEKIIQVIQPQGTIGEHYQLRTVQATNKKINEKHQALLEARDHAKRLERKLNTILNSKSWQLAQKLSNARNILKKRTKNDKT